MLVSALVYADRGIASSAAVSGAPRSAREPAGRGLQGALGCSYAAYGALNAAFMIGLLAGAPMFSAMANRACPLRLDRGRAERVAAVGELGCALAPTCGCAFAARALVGAGEASFVALAAPFIDDSAPKRAKTMWLAMFYACVPFGVAFGIAFGGAVAPALGVAMGVRVERVRDGARGGVLLLASAGAHARRRGRCECGGDVDGGVVDARVRARL